MQTVIIGIAAWPLYLIARKIANSKIALFMVLIYLLNPFIQNMNLFEFHILPFAIFTLLFAFYYYLENRYYLFLLFISISLLVREDVALVIAMFSLLSLLDKKSARWIITPGIIGILWFAGVFFIVPMLNNYDSYKFIFYYSWLGDSIGEIVKNFFFHPGLVLSHLFSLQNIFLYIALFLPFLLLPFLKPKYLLLSILVFLQLLLGSFSGELILKTHYSALLLVSVFITTSYALAHLFLPLTAEKPGKRARIVDFIRKEPGLFITVFVAVTIYGATTFGPIIPSIKAVTQSKDNAFFNQLKKEYFSLVPKEASVTTSYSLLPNLSSRSKLYSLHYAFIGKKQYTNDTYTLPETDYMLVDTNDFLIYQIQYPDNSFYTNAYSNGDNNIRSVFEQQNLKPVSVSDDLILFGKNSESDISLYNTYQDAPKIANKQDEANNKIAPDISFVGWDIMPYEPKIELQNDLNFKIIPLSFYWQVKNKQSKNYQLLIQLKDTAEKIIYNKYYALGYGILPTSEWQQNNYIQTNYWFHIPDEIYSASSNELYISMVELKDQHTYLGVDGMLTAKIKNAEYDSAGSEITIPLQDQ
jgi:uncharacterized membrane protein